MSKRFDVRLPAPDRERMELISKTYGWPMSVVLRTALRLLYQATGIEKKADLPLHKE